MYTILTVPACIPVQLRQFALLHYIVMMLLSSIEKLLFYLLSFKHILAIKPEICCGKFSVATGYRLKWIAYQIASIKFDISFLLSLFQILFYKHSSIQRNKKSN